MKPSDNRNTANVATITLGPKVRHFDQKDITLPEAWFAAWHAFGQWQLVDAVFGAAKFAGHHAALVKEVAAMAAQQCNDKVAWLVIAATIKAELDSSVSEDEECTAALTAAYAFAMAAATKKKQWALQTCAAAVAARAFGWSVHARSFSAELIYQHTSSETIAAQIAQLKSIISGPIEFKQRCAA